jgi:hypothetical protein
MAHDEDAMPGPQFRQMPTVTPGDGDVVETHFGSFCLNTVARFS